MTLPKGNERDPMANDATTKSSNIAASAQSRTTCRLMLLVLGTGLVGLVRLALMTGALRQMYCRERDYFTVRKQSLAS